jgi:GT2 family glycosyltransferase
VEKRVDLSVIILNYNTRDFLAECLSSLKNSKTDGLVFETIVVDNASVDGSAEMVRKYFPWVRFFQNLKNLGFSAGNNQVIAKSKGRYVLFLNPDTKVFPKTLATMVKYMDKNPNVGVATCRVELRNGELDDACHRGFPTPWNAFCHFFGLAKIFPKSLLFNGYHLGYQDLNKIHEIDACCGAFMIVRREVGEFLGWFDEDYFWYGEDLDFCYRVKMAGYKVMFVPTTKIIHWKGVASGIKKESQMVSTATSKTRRKAAFYSIEAMKIFYRKHYKNKYPKVLTFLVLLGISLLGKVRIWRLK